MKNQRKEGTAYGKKIKACRVQARDSKCQILRTPLRKLMPVPE
jgi:hypothetical protein